MGSELLCHVGPFLLPELLSARIDPCPFTHLKQQRDSGIPLLQEEQTQAIAGTRTSLGG